MSAKISLPAEKNPYAGRSPFEVLGVSRNATRAALRDANEEMLAEIENHAGYTDKERLAKKRELKDAYEALRDVKSRMSVEVFFFDGSAGRQECRAIAEKHKEVVFDFSKVLRHLDDIAPTAPDVQDAPKKFQPVTFEQSIVVKADGHRFAVDPRSEALESITFER